MSLSSPEIPMELREWDMTVLNNLVKYRDIERDNFDFKSKDLGDLANHVCAMANTITGILCLGVDEPASASPTAEFRPNGFLRGTEDDIKNSIRNFVVKVDPIPKVTPWPLTDEARDSFYMLLKVEGLEAQRPYTVKDRGQIFVRIGSSTTPASRTTIANLFINLLEKRNSIRKLQVHCRLLRSELIQTAEVIDTVDSNYIGIIPLLDLQSFKDAVSSAEWFLSEQNLLGQVNSNTATKVEGLYTKIHEFNVLNTTIDIFNKEQMNRPVRYTTFSRVWEKWKTDRNEFKSIIGSLDDIDQRCTKFLQSS
jgi:Putative DNA-binding domain